MPQSAANPTILACRAASYRPYEALAYGHLAGLGVRHVEITVPVTDNIEACAAELARFGLTATSLHGECDLSRPDVADQVAEQMPAFDALATRIMFVSVRAGETPLEMAYERLRVAGEVAARHGVVIALETHPDLVTNSRVAIQTMQGVNSPHVRINFDTANVYFSNRDIDAGEELRRILPYVAACHLKDTDGGYRHWHFPALGRGVVDFRATFSVLDEASFAGPCTLEIEGIEGEDRTERLVCDRVAESVGYLRGLGRI
jgi:sugar phosphate isomerase/epimerase